MLEIVEHQQRGRTVARGPRAPGQVERRGVQHTESLGNRRRDGRGVPNRGQPDKQHTGAFRGFRARKLQRQTGLAGSSGPGERDEACGGIREPVPQRLHVSLAAEKDRQRQGQRDVAQLIDRRRGRSGPRARQEPVTGRTSQIECRRQRAHGLDMGPPSFPALQRAHRMDRQARNRRELFLREARRLAERFELRAE